MIGAGIDRIDGPVKVTGRAAYSYERQAAERAVYGFIRGAGIAKGRIVGVDVAKAEAAPGVLAVFTHRNVPPQSERNFKPTLFDSPHPQLVGPDIEFYGQPVAFAVAETFEQARAAAALVEIEYEIFPGAFDLASHPERRTKPELLSIGAPAESRFGDLEAAMATAAVTVDQTYATPHHVANPLEPHGCLADWRDGHLTVYAGAQAISTYHVGLAETLQLELDQVLVDATFVGGGFGSKLHVRPEAVLASLASRALGRPVKAALTRRQVFPMTGHRPEMTHRVRLAADRDGRLLGLGHDVNMQGSAAEPWIEQAGTTMRSLYAAPNRLTRTYVTNLDIAPPDTVRGPGEVPGMLAVESAMDELAEALAMDPVELRLRNDTDIDPERNVPLNGRRLADCLREGARRFGWEDRPRTPASRRDGQWLVGYGVASIIRANYQGPSQVAVRLGADGRVLVKADMSDIGTGARTIAAQLAAETLGVSLAQVSVLFARSEYPKTAGAGGSWGAANISIALDHACRRLLDRIQAAAGRETPNDLFETVGRHFPDGIEATGETAAQADDPNFANFSQCSYGAAFAEVGVDAYTGETRLRRMTGVFAAGRILNAKTARSQLMGGMIWGVGSALHEAAHVDPRFGSWVNADLAEYAVPVHADIPAIDVVMLEDDGEHANHLGIKGVGELGVCGSGAAVANAVYNATGVRVRDFPIALHKLIAGLPAIGPNFATG
jgi:xanthine dehydrogenase YagR molybdenum-binding subunit